MSARQDTQGDELRCPSWETLVDLTYDELEPDYADQVRAHISTCDACTDTFKSLLGILKLADDLPGGPVPPSPQVEDRLKAEVLRQQPFYRRWLKWVHRVVTAPLPAYQVVLAGAVLALLFQLFVHGTPEGLKAVRDHLTGSAATSSVVGPHQAGFLGGVVMPVGEEPGGGTLETTGTPETTPQESPTPPWPGRHRTR